MSKTLALPKNAQRTIKSYFELPLGRKKVKCPYFMNLKRERAGLRVMIGKGTAEEIVHEVRVWAQLKGVNLNKLSEKEIRSFMIKKGIGIDCSGFAVYVLNGWLKELGYGHLWNNLKYRQNAILDKIRRRFRPVENISAELLTSDLNCMKITNLDQVLPGDLIRAKGKIQNAHHVAVISEVLLDEHNKVTEFKYVHSHRYYGEENGVRKGSVKIIKQNNELKDQKWVDNYEGRNYMLEDLLVGYQDNGIRRLNLFNTAS